jgi:serine/threonine-protein kinase
VALKVLPAHLIDDRDARVRFQRELRIAVALEHPNLVPVYDAGYERGVFYIAMRLVDGPDLSRVIPAGGLPIDRALRLFAQIAQGLFYVHRQGYVHRDIKPQNVLLAEPGGAHEYALLADFGISRALESSTALTRGIIGTAEYMAPEIAQWRPAQPASDQYALACLLFEMLTGASPFRGEELPAAHLHSEPPRLTAVRPEVPARIAKAVEHALAKVPEERFADVAAFARAVGSPTAATDAREAPATATPSAPPAAAPERLMRPEAVTPTPSAGAPPEAPGRRAWRPRIAFPLWVLWPILSVGVFAGVGFGWAALRRGQRDLAPWAIAYGAWGVTVFVLAATTGDAKDTVAQVIGLALLLVWIGSAVHAILAASSSRDRARARG